MTQPTNQDSPPPRPPHTALPADERRRIIVEWNATKRPYPSDAGLARLFEETAARMGDAVALEHGTSTMSYRELDRRANALARRLRERGVSRGRFVALLVERTPSMVVAMLAILKAGGAYVPLDPSYPAERLALMIDDAAPSAIVGDADLLGALPSFSVPALEVDAIEDERPPPGESAGGDLAYVMFTSGSTGRPKAVCVPQRAVARLVLGTDYVALGPDDRVAQASNASFDAATFEIWGALLNGARLVLIDRTTALDALRLSETLEAARITTLFITTALLNEIAELRPSTFRGLTTLLFGGEAVSTRAVRAILKDPPRRFLHVYGPTETTTFATWFQIRDLGPDARTVPIGHPIANTTVHVLDPSMQPVAVSDVGEVYVGGDGNALGYWRRPELTADRFVPDPYGPPGATLYRTGDLARRDPTGAVEFVGRADNQVKIRGHRIELGEVESVLARLDGVGRTIVIAREDTPGDKRMVAYVVGAPGRALRGEALRAALAEALPAYMVPSVVVVLDDLPLNENGKVDRKALPVPDYVAAAGAAYAAPTNDLERVLVRIWSEALRVPTVGLDDPFTGIGGSSLVAVRVLARIDAELGVSLPFTAMFEHATVRALAAELSRRGVAASGPDARAKNGGIARIRARHDGVPVSAEQFPYWFTEQIMPGINVAAIRIDWPRGRSLDLVTLQRAVDAVVSRHEILRTTYAVVKGRPMQRIEPAGRSQPIAHTDLRGQPPEAQAEQVARIERALASTRFDLKKGPVLKVHAISLSDEERFLLACAHHVAWDGQCSIMLGHELSVFYEAYDHGAPIDLPPLRVQYADYSEHQRARLEAGEARAAVEHWAKRLEGATALALPVDRPRRARGSYACGRVEWSLDVPTSARLRAAALERSTTIWNLVSAAAALTVGRAARATDVVLGMTVSTRDRAELDPLFGCFVNTLPLRVDLAVTDLGELLRRMEVATREALSNNVPFDRIVERVGRTREIGRQPIYDVLLAGQSDATQPATDAFQAHRIEAIAPEMDRDLQFQIEQLADAIHGWTQYRTELYDEATVSRIARDLVAILEAFAEGRLPDPLA